MADLRQKLLYRSTPRVNQLGVCTFFLCLAFLSLFGMAGNSAAAGPNVQNLPAPSFEPGPQFAIADFDGDVRPDWATIQAGLNNSGDTNYWIQLQLSTGGPQSIRLVGPAGGLRIEARDVNGDHAVDLVLATAWFRQPVAVLLNDGHGRFSRVEPTAFPDAFADSRTNWGSASNVLGDALGFPPESRAGICQEGRGLLRGRSPTNRISFSSADFLVNLLFVSHAGRAPPSDIFSL